MSASEQNPSEQNRTRIICFERIQSYSMDFENKMGESHEVGVSLLCQACKHGGHGLMNEDDRFAKLAINLDAHPCMRFQQESFLAIEHLIRSRDKYSNLIASFDEYSFTPVVDLDMQIEHLRDLQSKIVKSLFNLDRVVEMIESSERYIKNKELFQKLPNQYVFAISKE
jgi:hypothetical protein